MTASPAALVFDAYGTLFDVHSVVALCDELWPGKGAQLSQLWRTNQLQHTWLRSLMGRYEDFAHVTEAALRYACAALALPYDDAKRSRLMRAYLHLATFPEVKDALARLRGIELAILSNGAPAMLPDLVTNSWLSAAIPHVLSVDEVGIYKPSPGSTSSPSTVSTCRPRPSASCRRTAGTRRARKRSAFARSG